MIGSMLYVRSTTRVARPYFSRRGAIAFGISVGTGAYTASNKCLAPK